MPDKTKQEAMEAVLAERGELLERIRTRADVLVPGMPPMAPLAPYRENVVLDERGDAVAVISLEGLRRIDAMLSELEQGRNRVAELEGSLDAAEELVADPDA